MSSSLNDSSVSGIYTCSCGNLETHIKGKSKAPCSKCGKNNSWTLIIRTEELEDSLKYPYSYPITDLVLKIKERYANK